MKQEMAAAVANANKAAEAKYSAALEEAKANSVADFISGGIIKLYEKHSQMRSGRPSHSMEDLIGVLDGTLYSDFGGWIKRHKDIRQMKVTRANICTAMVSFLNGDMGKELSKSLTARMHCDLGQEKGKLQRAEYGTVTKQANDRQAKTDAKALVWKNSALPKLARTMRKWRYGALERVIMRWKGYRDVSVALAEATELKTAQERQAVLGKAMAEEAALESNKNK